MAFPAMAGLSMLAWLTRASEVDRDQAERDPDPRSVVRNLRFVLGMVLGATCVQPSFFVSSVA